MPFLTDSAVLINPISANKGTTSQGYLVANNALIARTGVQYYLSEELGIRDEQGRPVMGKTIKVYRLPEDVHDPLALQSIESAPVTDDHPNEPEGVTLDNHAILAKGHGRNIRPEGDNVGADLVITDPALIRKVQDKQKVQISLGYTCSYEPYKDGYKQTNIRVNHIAVVTKGRAGERVKIYDSQPKRKKQVFKNAQEAQAAMFTAYCKDASPEEAMAAMKFLSLNDAAPAAVVEKNNEAGLLAKLVGMLSAKPVKDADSDEDKEDEKKDKKTEDSKILAALDALNARFDALEAKVNDADGDDDEDEDDEKATKDADPDEDEDEEKKKTEDSAAAIAQVVKDMKPFLAKLPEKDRKQANDALRKALGQEPKGKSSGKYLGIMNAIATPNRDAAPKDKAQLGQEIAAKFNPHYKKQA